MECSGGHGGPELCAFKDEQERSPHFGTGTSGLQADLRLALGS